MTANFFTSQLWCYVYNNVLFFIERERERERELYAMTKLQTSLKF
jgi:hypothetical protein